LEITHLEDVVIDTMEQMEKGGVPGLKSNFWTVADAIGVYGKGEMTIVAARPSMGKSCLVKDEVRLWAKKGVKCGIIPLEETKGMIARKYLSAEGSVDNYRVRDGRSALKPEDWAKLTGAAGRLGQLPIYIADGVFGTQDVVSAANLLVAQHGCEVVVVDHMHLIDQSEGEDDVAKLSKISRTLKFTMKRLDVVGMVVAQLNRGNTKRDDKRPTMSDVRGCGSIEQDVDTMLLLHREDYYQTDKSKHTGLAEIIIAKARDGRTGAVDLKFNGKYQRFEDVGPLDPFM
jgi:replicative DNA helicase